MTVLRAINQEQCRYDYPNICSTFNGVLYWMNSELQCFLYWHRNSPTLWRKLWHNKPLTALAPPSDGTFVELQFSTDHNKMIKVLMPRSISRLSLLNIKQACRQIKGFNSVLMTEVLSQSLCQLALTMHSSWLYKESLIEKEAKSRRVAEQWPYHCIMHASLSGETF